MAAPLTWQGITLYGTIDVGAAHQDHGAPLDSYFGPGVEDMIQKNSRGAVTSLQQNGMSQSKIGVRGDIPLIAGWNGVFKLETGVSPLAFRLSDYLKSMRRNNGKTVSAQASAGDSSRAGQIFQGGAYAGLQAKQWGSVTGGRQNSLMLDDILVYDPQGGSYGFSPIGYSGVAGGLGDTEDARLDGTIKYAVGFGNYHLAALGKVNSGHTEARDSWQIAAGTKFGGFGADLVYGVVDGAVSVGNLSAAQLKLVSSNYLSAIISDNTAYGLMARYDFGKPVVLAGYEHIDYNNPAHMPALNSLDTTEGGYQVIIANTAATFPHTKVLQISWAGVRYQLLPAVTVNGAFYHYDQNAYGAQSCSTAKAANCFGALDAASLSADYRWTAAFDTYAGVVYYGVRNGLASGYINSAEITELAGGRYNF